MATIEVVKTNAAKLRELHERVHDAARHRNEGKEANERWRQATKAYHEQYDQLAYPGGLNQFLSRLPSKDPETIELVIEYLEADPWFFRSGYIKEHLLSYLKHAPLTSSQRLRLQYLILRKIEGKWLREFRYYARLAPVVADREFTDRVSAFLDSERTVSQRAHFVLQCCRAAPARK